MYLWNTLLVNTQLTWLLTISNKKCISNNANVQNVAYQITLVSTYVYFLVDISMTTNCPSLRGPCSGLDPLLASPRCYVLTPIAWCHYLLTPSRASPSQNSPWRTTSSPSTQETPCPTRTSKKCKWKLYNFFWFFFCNIFVISFLPGGLPLITYAPGGRGWG